MANYIETTGFDLYFSAKAQGADYTIYNLGCLTGSIDLGQDSRATNEIKCFSGASFKISGGITFGDVSIEIIADPTNAIQILFRNLANKQVLDLVDFAIGWSDGTSAPTCDPATGLITAPTTRTWDLFQGKITSVGETIAIDDVVRFSATISRETSAVWQTKV